MKSFFLIFFIFLNSLYSYDDAIEDIMNEYKFRKDITKLLRVKESSNIRSCNKISCEKKRVVPKNTLLSSSNFDEWYQIKVNEWISPELVEEVKIFNQKDYILKKNLKVSNRYVVYKGKVKKEPNKEINISENIFLILDNNDHIITKTHKYKKFELIKGNIKKEFNFKELLRVDLSNFKTLKEYEYKEEKENHNFFF